MKKTVKIFIIGCLVVFFLTICKSCIVDPVDSIKNGFGITTVAVGDKVRHISLSPDSLMRVIVVELRPSFDRNYEVYLQRRGESLKTVYSSPDISGELGTERIVWLPDSSQFILLTSNPKQDGNTIELKGGERIVFLYDVVIGRFFFPSCKIPQELQYPGYTCYPITPDSLKKFQQEKQFS